MANVITGLRIFCSIAMLFPPVFSPAFYALYLTAGISDMLDGPIARKTGKVSELGSRLDSAADLVFVAVCLVKLIPLLTIPRWLYIWIGVIALIRVVNLISGFVMRKRVIVLHTAMNKLTGSLLFILPLTLPFLDLTISAPVVCAAASFAAIQEGRFIRTEREGSS